MAARSIKPIALLLLLLLLTLLTLSLSPTHAFRFGARPRLPHVTLRIWRRRADPSTPTAAPPVVETQQPQAGGVRPQPAVVVVDPKAVGDEGPWVKAATLEAEGDRNGEGEEERRLLTRWCVCYVVWSGWSDGG
jgi:hypothetical protein